MKPVTTNETNTQAVGPKGFEFVESLPAEKEHIILDKTYTVAHTMRYELEPEDIEAIKAGHTQIVVTCIGMLPILAVGLQKVDLEEFRGLYLKARRK